MMKTVERRGTKYEVRGTRSEMRSTKCEVRGTNGKENGAVYNSLLRRFLRGFIHLFSCLSFRSSYFLPRTSYLVPRTLYLLLFFLVGNFCAPAQFLPYSQYQNTPLLTNPSQAALSDFTQFTVNYRRSRVANYEVPSVSFVHPFYRNRDGLRISGVGVNVISQSAGPGGAFKVMGATGTFAYNVHLSRRHHLSAGIQGGVINKRLDPSGLTTDNQFNFGAFDPSLSTGENFAFNSISKPIVNSGFSWTFTDSSSTQRALLGVAFFNMNQPSFQLGTESNSDAITYTITGEMLLVQCGRAELRPTFRYMSGTAPFANVGALLQYGLARENSSLLIGGWYKTTQALVGAIQYNDRSYSIAASMDFSAASGLQANIHNAIEFSLTWRLQRKIHTRPSPPFIRTTLSSLTEASEPVEPVSEAQVEEVVAMEEQPAEQNAPPETEAVQVQELVATETAAPASPVQHEITPEEYAVLNTHIAFKLGSSELTRESEQFIKTKLALVLQNHPEHTLRITGHSCTIGDKAINEEISLQRAEAIGKILRQAGIPENRLVMVGMDFQKPVASNDTEEGRQKNRRVEFELVKN